MFKWRRILITGASSGLGWALSLALARPGIFLFLSGRDEFRLSQIARLVQEKGAYALTCASDLATGEGVKRLAALIEEELPDLLIHSAGVGAYGKFSDIPVEKALEILQLNIAGTVAITHAWCHSLLSRGHSGKVVFISSAAGFQPFPGMTVYAASKAFLTNFSEGLRYELKGQGIEVLTVCPGHFGTNFQQRSAGKGVGDPASAEAADVAKDIIRVLRREGIYIPFPWRWLLKMKRFVPKRLLLGHFQRRVLSYLR